MKKFAVIFLFFIHLADLHSKCVRPEQGPPGLSGGLGLQGAQGPTGATGAQGPAGPGELNTFATLYSITNNQPVMMGNSVLYDGADQIFVGGIVYNAGVVTLPSAGYYRVAYGVSANNANRQFQLYLNNAAVDGSQIDTASGSSMQAATIIIQVAALDDLKLVNNSANTTLTTSSGDSLTTFLVIEKIHD